MIKKIIILSVLLSTNVANVVFASEVSMQSNSLSNQTNIEVAVQQMKEQWAAIKYHVPKEQKVKQLESLIKKIDDLAQQNPNDALPLLWEGTMLSTLASLKSGLSALGTAKKAKATLEKSLIKDPTAENGYAHVILGALYARVPGKPVGFGNKETAKHHFQTALRMDPDGLETNYFYGDFLMAEGAYPMAKVHFEKADKAPVNPDSRVFEKGRRQELASAMKIVKQKVS